MNCVTLGCDLERGHIVAVSPWVPVAKPLNQKVSNSCLKMFNMILHMAFAKTSQLKITETETTLA